MSQRYDLSGIAGNDLPFNFSLTSGTPPVPVNLTGVTVTAYLKAAAVTPDAIALTFTASSGLTVTSAADGQFTWVIPADDVPPVDAPGSLWYRIDLASGGLTETAMYGAIILTAV